MKTDFETLMTLASYTINNLQEHKFIEYPVDQRAVLIDSMATEYCSSFATDEDIRSQAIEEVEDKLGQGVIEGDVTETEVYNHARKEIIKSFNGECISGLYLVESLNKVAQRVTTFLLNNDTVDDVFASDEDLNLFLIAKLRNFSSKKN